VVVDLDLDVADAGRAAQDVALAGQCLAQTPLGQVVLDEGQALGRIADADPHDLRRLDDGRDHLARGDGVQVPQQLGQAARQHVELGIEVSLQRLLRHLGLAQPDEQAADDERGQQQADAGAERQGGKERGGGLAAQDAVMLP
jgi:hypothetical protein